MKKTLSLIISIIAFSFQANAQDLWPSDAVNTGSNATYAIQSVTFDDQDLLYGIIGAFFTNDYGELQCGGWQTWADNTSAIAVQGDDNTTDEQDGFASGEEITWLATIDGVTTYIASVEYSMGPGGMGSSNYVTNGINFISEFTISDIIYASNSSNLGCTDVTACNYDATATDNDGSCTYAETYYDCDGGCLNDADADGVCDELEVLGCTDSLYVEFNPLATEGDVNGLCITLIVEGCIDDTSCNYNPYATEDDGSCIYAELGYDCEGNCINDIDLDGVCDEVDNCIYSPNPWQMDSDNDGVGNECEIGGCIDITACNFDVTATDDGGSCVYAEMYYDCDGNCINDIDLDGICDELEVTGCTDNAACNFDALATDNFGCVFAEPNYDCGGGCLNDTDSDGVCDEEEVPGCTDPVACNFDATATDDDESCTFAEPNYECDGSCINDLDLDGICDEVDNCVDISNTDQLDDDDDGEGDACDYNDGIGIEEVHDKGPVLMKMIDVLGREQKEHKKGSILFYIYDNGVVEKRMTH